MPTEDTYYWDKLQSADQALPPSRLKRDTYLNWINFEPVAPGSASEADAQAQTVHNQEVARQVDNVLTSNVPADEKAATLLPLAEAHGSAPTNDDVGRGVYNQMAAQDSDPVRRDLIMNADVAEKWRNENAKYVEMAIGQNVPDQSGGHTTLEFLETLLPGKYTMATQKLLNKYVPDSAFSATPDERRKALQYRLRNMPPPEFKKFVDDIINTFDDSVGVPSTENQFFKWAVLQEFIGTLGTVDEDTQRKLLLANPDATFGQKAMARVSDVLDTDVLTALDVVAVAGAGRAILRGAGALADVGAAFKLMKQPHAFDFQLTEMGAKRAVSAATSPNPSAATALLGTNPATVAVQHALPTPGGLLDIKGAKLKPPEPPSGRPDLSAFYLSEESANTQYAGFYRDLKGTFGLRLNDTVIHEAVDGMEATVRLGKKGGTGFASEKSAQTWAKQKMGGNPYTIVKDEVGTFQVELKQARPWRYDEAGEPLPGFVKNRLAIGRASVFHDWFNQSMSTALRTQDFALKAVRERLQPFTKLRGESSERVQETLVWADGLPASTKRVSDIDLQARNLSAEEIEAVHAVRSVSDRLWAAKNANARFLMEAEGWKEAILNGQQALVRPVGAIASTADKVVDLSTGKVVPAAALQPGGQFYRLMDNVQRGAQYGYVAPGANAALRKLPVTVLHYHPNAIPRHYTASHFIRKYNPGTGTWDAFKTARSKVAAERELELQLTIDPANQYKAFEASSISESFHTSDELSQAIEEGLTYTSARRTNALVDVEGESMVNAFDAVNSMAHSVAGQEGVVQLVNALKPVFKNKFGFDLNLQAFPVRPRDISKLAKWTEARAVWRQLRLMSGLDSNILGDTFRATQNAVADFFYNTGTYLRFGPDVLINPARRLASVSDWFGDNISGLKPSLVQTLKTGAMAKYIIANVPTQWLLQTSAVFAYSGVRHGFRYMAGGGWARDMAILEARGVPKLAEQIGMAGGLTRKQVQELLTDAARSGIDEAVEGHISALGTYTQGRIGRETLAGKTLQGAYDTLKKVGFDWGTRRDKRGAWLVLRNRAKKDGQDLSDFKVQREINNNTEGLTGNLNRSDPLVAPHGLMSLLLQFAGHPMKMTQRLLGGTVAGSLDLAGKVAGKPALRAASKKWLETGFTAGEQTRYGLTTLFFYGAGGLGVNEIAERLFTEHERETGQPIPETARLVVREGLLGSSINVALRAMFDPEDAGKPGGPKQTSAAYSERFSPLSHVGMYAQNMGAILSAIGSLDPDQLANLGPSAASLNLLGNTKQWLDRSWFLTFHVNPTDLQDHGKVFRIATEYLKTFPVVSNVLRAAMGQKLMAKMDQSGNGIVSATEGELLMQALFGVKSTDEIDFQKLSVERYGKGGKDDPEGLGSEVEREADANWNRMLPFFTRMPNGEFDIEQVSNMIKNHTLTYFTLLEPHQWQAYRDLMYRRLLKGTGELKDEKLFQSIYMQLEKVPGNQSFADKVRGLDYRFKNELLDKLEASFEAIPPEEDE